MWGRAGVQPASWSILEESSTEPSTVALGHGHVHFCGVDDVANAAVLVVFWVVPAVMSGWWWSSGGWVVG